MRFALCLLLLAYPAVAQDRHGALPVQHPLKGDAAEPRANPGRCPAPLRSNCEAQQGSCQIACPSRWSTNPAAPAFTPTDRAGCLRACFNHYLSCLALHGCV